LSLKTGNLAEHAASRAGLVFSRTVGARFRNPLPADRIIEKFNSEHTDMRSFPCRLAGFAGELAGASGTAIKISDLPSVFSTR
jgi:hypothetical protein